MAADVRDAAPEPRQKCYLRDKMSFINETDYAELVGLCGICPIMRKVTNYAQNYARIIA